MFPEVSIPALTFLAVSSLVLLVATLVTGRATRLDARLRDLSGLEQPAPEPDLVAVMTRSALPKLGAPLVPTNADERSRLRTRLMHAGLYSRQSMVVFLGVKMLLMVGPACLGALVAFSGVVDVAYGVVVGALLGVVGMIGPSFWLDSKKASRQRLFRRGLPDALDVVVICLEGGLSLPGALRRVSDDLKTAHPLLAGELNLVQREVQLGRTPGEALRQLADRADLEEMHSLASVIIQADRLGASLVKSLRVHAETLRLKRRQRAEEMAQKAGTKILFPTILFIFPVLFVVILAPGLIQIAEMFGSIR